MNYIVDIDDNPISIIGMKAYALSRLKKSGFKIPKSAVIVSDAYQDFIRSNNLFYQIEIELGRKSMLNMRWEELWDCALRIRNIMMRAVIPDVICHQISEVYSDKFGAANLAVRSSSTQEDMHNASFAGLYDSYINCNRVDEVTDSVRKVWCSLWSDRSLLYRKEINLDPFKSTMAILLQEFIPGQFSGVTFTRSPNNAHSEEMLIEAVPGICASLVDGSSEPDSFLVNRKNLKLSQETRTIKNKADLSSITLEVVEQVASIAMDIEKLFKAPVDVEWTWVDGEIIILQARPISYQKDINKKRLWYLSLTPEEKELDELFYEVNSKLIPSLKMQGEKMEKTNLETLTKNQISQLIEKRFKTLSDWRRIYKEKFIPFAHGIRQFAQFYNDSVKPKDAYEFIELLKSEERIARIRQNKIAKISHLICKNDPIKRGLKSWLKKGQDILSKRDLECFSEISDGKQFIHHYNILKRDFFDITYDTERWIEHDDVIIKLLLNYAVSYEIDENCIKKKKLLANYLNAVPDKTHAKHILSIGKISWTLRDDDNLLLSKIESQCYLALQKGVLLLVNCGQLSQGVKAIEDDVSEVLKGLKDEKYKPILIKKCINTTSVRKSRLKARQLKGQPAVPGLASGVARHINCFNDIKRFRPGDIILCDAIDPNMTHLVPLASAIIERRGGMLIHGVIIARELSIPCVNGIDNLLEEIDDGDFITVDGGMGIVIIGKPDFDL